MHPVRTFGRRPPRLVPDAPPVQTLGGGGALENLDRLVLVAAAIVLVPAIAGGTAGYATFPQHRVLGTLGGIAVGYGLAIGAVRLGQALGGGGEPPPPTATPGPPATLQRGVPGQRRVL